MCGANHSVGCLCKYTVYIVSHAYNLGLCFWKLGNREYYIIRNL
jgi:hypothetical protein